MTYDFNIAEFKTIIFLFFILIKYFKFFFYHKIFILIKFSQINK